MIRPTTEAQIKALDALQAMRREAGDWKIEIHREGDLFFANLLTLRADTFDRYDQVRATSAFLTPEEAIASLFRAEPDCPEAAE